MALVNSYVLQKSVVLQSRSCFILHRNSWWRKGKKGDRVLRCTCRTVGQDSSLLAMKDAQTCSERHRQILFHGQWVFIAQDALSAVLILTGWLWQACSARSDCFAPSLQQISKAEIIMTKLGGRGVDRIGFLKE